MARLNICGFETGDLSEAASTSGTVSATSATKRTGSYAGSVTTGLGSSLHYIAFGKHAADGKHEALGLTEAWFRFYFYVSSSFPSPFEGLAKICSSANLADGVANGVVAFYVESTGQVGMQKPGGTSVAIGTVANSTWNMLEIHAVQNSTCYARLNGGSEVSLSACGNETIDYIALGKAYRFGDVAYTVLFDDLAIDDAAYPGAGEVRVAVPTGNSATNTAWSASFGNKWECIDELPPSGGSDYIESLTTAGDRLYSATHASCATLGVTGTIAALKTVAALWEPTSTTTLGAIGIRSNSANTVTTSADVGNTTIVTFAQVWGSDPNNSNAAWTSSAVDAAEPIVKRSSSDTSNIRCGWLGLMIECYGLSTNYTQSVAGSSGNVSGTLARRTLKSLTGISGALSGILTRKALKVLSGNISSLIGSLTAFRLMFMSVAGTMGTLSATITKKTIKSLSGTVGSLTASLVRVTQKAFVGVTGSVSGTLVRATRKALSGISGALTGSLAAGHVFGLAISGAVGSLLGTIAKQTRRTLLGSTGSIVGTLAKLVSKVLSGTSGSMSGSLSRQLVKIVNLVGAVGTVSATLTRFTIKTVSSTLNQIVGSLSRGFLKNVSLSGVLNSFSGNVGWYGIVKRAKMKAGEVSTTTVKAGTLAAGTVMKAGSVLVTRLRGGWRNK